MGHLVLKSHQLLLKVFDLHLEVLHGGFPVCDYALKFLDLKLQVPHFSFEMCSSLNDTFFLTLKIPAGEFCSFELLRALSELSLHANYCILAHLFLPQMVEYLFSQHRVKLVAFVIARIGGHSSYRSRHVY